MISLERGASTKAIAGFKGKARRVTITDCWEWTGATSCGKNGKPYGQVRWVVDGKEKSLYAHRVAYALAHDVSYESLRGFDVHHVCGNTLCVNPAHLVKEATAEHGRRHRFGQLDRESDGYAAYAAAEEVGSV